jgi:FKBP-type peptidyl-prolyl cis-trans isomerase FklB
VETGASNGQHPNRTSPCVCHYEGSLIDGSVFDSSIRRGKTATFAPSQVMSGTYFGFRDDQACISDHFESTS